MPHFKLKRTGQDPLEFDGTVIGVSLGHEGPKGGLRTRWHNIMVYRTEDDDYIVRIAYHHRLDYGRTHYHVECTDQAGVAAMLDAYQPGDRLGPPLDDPAVERRRRASLASISVSYRAQVEEVLAEAGLSRPAQAQCA